MIQVERMVRNLCEMVQIPSESSKEQEFIGVVYFVIFYSISILTNSQKECS